LTRTSLDVLANASTDRSSTVWFKAIKQLGIRERSSRREIGDYRLGRLLHDIDADTTTGVAYRDFERTHRSLALTRRLRLYALER
jgi:hypothetical protein